MILRRKKIAREINSALSLYQKVKAGKKKIWWYETQMKLIRSRYKLYEEIVEEIFIKQQEEKGIFVT